MLSAADLRAHGENPDHVSNLSVRAWGTLFGREGWRFRYLGHRCRRSLDFGSLQISTARPEDFSFVEESLEGAYAAPPITAVYELRRAR